MAFDYRQAIFSLRDMGLLDVILPFVLIFTVVFAILQKSNVLGPSGTAGAATGDAKRYNGIVAFVIGLLVVIPHVLYGTGTSSLYVGGRQFPDVVYIINNALPSISVWIIAIVMVMVLMGTLGFEPNIAGRGLSSWVMYLAIAIVAYTFAVAAGWFDVPRWAYWLNDRGNQAAILTVLVFGIVAKLAFGGGNNNQGGNAEQLARQIREGRQAQQQLEAGGGR